jgi:hypothetical protein
MLEFMLGDQFEGIACVSPHGPGKITIEWNHSVRDSMPRVVIWIGDLEADLDAREEEHWEREPG